jgi:hypothetical protein
VILGLLWLRRRALRRKEVRLHARLVESQAELELARAARGLVEEFVEQGDRDGILRLSEIMR